jgi:N-acetylated-alpha-linked acidic dipeptidase
MWKLIRAATRDVKDPKSGQSVYQRWQDRAREQQPDPELASASATAEKPMTEARIGALGSGSDFTPFLQHLGVPASDMGFNGDYGVYHSAYDSFYWMSHFGDPDFVYHVAAAQVWGTVAMRLADAAGVPLDYRDYAWQMREFFNECMRLAKIRKLDGAIDEKPMTRALENFADEAERIQKARDEATAEVERTRVEANDRHPRAVARLKRINDALLEVERSLTDDRGLRGRNWYTHQIYAPGTYTGYAAQPLPDFRQALDDRNTADAVEGLGRIVAAINRAAETLHKARD